MFSTFQQFHLVMRVHYIQVDEKEQLVVTFRYGREEDEIMGLRFSKELYLASQQLYPNGAEVSNDSLSNLQTKLMKKLGPSAIPFTFNIPQQAPASVTIQPGPNDQGQPCGVEYVLKLYVADGIEDRGHKRSSVSLAIRKIQFAPNSQGRQPCAIVRKDFLLSPGQVELEVTLDKQLYHHGETITANVSIHNHSNKLVKRIKTAVVQNIDVCLFATGQYKAAVATIETEEGCPIVTGAALQKVFSLTPLLDSNLRRRGVALDGMLKNQDTNLASTTLLFDADQKDAFGIIVSYTVKVKLHLGAMGGELVAELPFILMHPKPKPKLIHADSQFDVEQMTSSRQNTFDDDGPLMTELDDADELEEFSRLKIKQS